MKISLTPKRSEFTSVQKLFLLRREIGDKIDHYISYRVFFCVKQQKVPVSQRIWTPRSISASGSGPPGANPLTDLDPLPRIWTPQTKMSENIIVLVKMDDTLCSSAYLSMFLIQNMHIVNTYDLASRRMFLLTKGKWARI